MQMLPGVTRSKFSASILNSKTVSSSPSLHKPSEAFLHVTLHCTSVALTIRAKKMAGAIRGAERDHAERIIAERRHVDRIMPLGERDTGKEICGRTRVKRKST
jgi:hypothetical protein